MKTKQLFLSLLFLGTGTFAQQVNYYFEQFTHNYTDLSNPISVNNNLIWDDYYYTIPVGFEYKLFNTTSNQIVMDDFELMTHGGITSNSLVAGIIVYSADLADRAYEWDNNGDNVGSEGSLSPISYQIDDFGNSKIFKLEWKNAGFEDDDNNSYYMNFQLWIYEGSNMIEIHYGPSSVPNYFYADQENACGLYEYDWNEDVGQVYIVEEGTDGYQFEIPDFDDDDDDWEPNFFTRVPENGTGFRFYPKNSVGMDELESVIQIHPNPATDFLYLENDEQLPMEYQVVSLDGRILKTGTSSEQKIQIDLSDLNPGIYFVRGTKNGNNLTKTISKI